MTVSLYDLLDVEEDATAADIRSAWKRAIADLDPTDRRFRAYNDAAGLLLDPEKRTTYDAELAATRAREDVDATDEDTTVDEPETDEPATDEPETDEPATDEPAADAVPATAPVVLVEDESETAAEPERDGEDDVPAPAEGPSTAAMALAAVVAVLSLALAIVVLSWPGSVGGTSPGDQTEEAEEAESAAAAARAAAADAIPVVLSYDYRTLEADFGEAEGYLTDEFAAKRTALFDQQSESGLTLREQVVTDKVVVDAAVWDSGVTRVSDEGDRATIVVFVDQDSRKGKAAPRSLKMWATLIMVAEGDDWLLDDICTEDDCG